jgi:hypothetical protein
VAHELVAHEIVASASYFQHSDDNCATNQHQLANQPARYEAAVRISRGPISQLSKKERIRYHRIQHHSTSTEIRWRHDAPLAVRQYSSANSTGCRKPVNSGDPRSSIIPRS